MDNFILFDVRFFNFEFIDLRNYYLNFGFAHESDFVRLLTGYDAIIIDVILSADEGRFIRFLFKYFFDYTPLI